jgi:hypothetical protein
VLLHLLLVDVLLTVSVSLLGRMFYPLTCVVGVLSIAEGFRVVTLLVVYSWSYYVLV